MEYILYLVYAKYVMHVMYVCDVLCCAVMWCDVM